MSVLKQESVNVPVTVSPSAGSERAGGCGRVCQLSLWSSAMVRADPVTRITNDGLVLTPPKLRLIHEF